MNKPRTIKPSLTTTLNDAAVGMPVRVRELCGEPSDCQRLREMGFCEYAEICKLAQSDALICRVHNAKVILSKCLADSILVETIPHSKE